jgi:5'-nucleotidase
MNYKNLIFVLLFLSLFGTVFGAEQRLTILHTNDLHSHLMPFIPRSGKNSIKNTSEKSVGGFARIATILKRYRQEKECPVLTLDAGDFTMGTLFHTLTREQSFELRLMKQMGYDCVTLGNHEFDMKPEGLAKILQTAAQHKQLPEIVFSNAVFSKQNDEDDKLESLFDKQLIKPYTIINKSEIRIGIFGLMGKDAAEKAVFSRPVTFSDPIKTAQDIVKTLRDEEKVDIVICLSHSGINTGSTSEDKELARRVKDIDIIISAHCHSQTPVPIEVNDTIIVQAGEYGEAVGVLDLILENSNLKIDRYELVAITEDLPENQQIKETIDSYINKLDQKILAPYGLTYNGISGCTDFDLTISSEESNCGNFLADAILWYANQHIQKPQKSDQKVQIAIKANGVIRSNIIKGKTGKLRVADLFRILPLGIGLDKKRSPGYPLLSFYLYPYEIKRALEIITSVYPQKGPVYFLQISGLKFTYNSYRMIFDRVTKIKVESENGNYVNLDYSRSNKRLYRVALNYYEAKFLSVIGNFTYDFLKIIPRDSKGHKIENLVDCRIDGDSKKEGIQELKEWVAIIKYIEHFPDQNSDGLADIPQRYRQTEDRIIKRNSLNPLNLLYRGTTITWLVFIIIVFAGIGCILIIHSTLKKIFAKKTIS